jgi:hypothetical protein
VNLSFVCVEMNSLDLSTYGHIPQGLLHGLVPVVCLFWCCLVFGSAARQSLSLRLGGCLYAIMGGSGNISFAFGSLLRVRQCFRLNVFCQLQTFAK